MPKLAPDDLFRSCAPDELEFATTDDVADITEIVGQPRAAAAIQFGVGIERDGYNLVAIGAPGTGRRSIIMRYLAARARDRPPPPELCYVYNFDDANRPRLLVLPPGAGSALSRDMDALVDEIPAALAAAFESDDYHNRREAIDQEFRERQEGAFADIETRASKEGLTLLRTPMGMGFAPVRDGEVLSAEQFSELPEAEQDTLRQLVERYQEEAQRVFRQIPTWDRERRDAVRALDRDVAHLAVGAIVDELREKHGELPKVRAYLDAVLDDITQHAQEFVKEEPRIPVSLLGGGQLQNDRRFDMRRYAVNVLVASNRDDGAAVLLEDHPTHDNLVGRIEHVSHLGALVTDHTLIKPGALHRANGGYLVLEALKLLRAPNAYEALKRALRSKRLRIESLGQALGLVSTVSLEPEPADLDVQVVLLCDPMLFYLLSDYDPEVDELFKVVVDFDREMAATDHNRAQYVRLLATLARSESLRPFDRGAIARVIEQSGRLAGDRTKLSARMSAVTDVMREADYWAREAGRDVVTASDVQEAIDTGIRRLDRYRERYQEEILRHIIKIDTSGERVAQVNGLSVVSLGRLAFGHPTRITARARVGDGEVLDIEREVELGGPIHSKGVLILEAFLGSRYASELPLSLAASVVFEQTYGGVEGDSASAAELLALLSAIGEVPIQQCFAVTGSVNQHGEIQAVGGVNEKIEGFFDVCQARGLTGEHAVLLPVANVEHLMLKHDVVQAVRDGRFHVHAVHTIDECAELMTGLPAGARDAKGAYPEGSFNRRVDDRLTAFAEERRAFRSSDDDIEE